MHTLVVKSMLMHLIILLIDRKKCFIFCGYIKRNVVLIMFDDLRPALSGYGDKLANTPNIDNFMKGSFYFTRAYSQQALCAPSRNSMLTSRRPDTLHLYDFYSYWRTFSGNFTTLPQYFKENGYNTYSIGKIFHPGISSNFSDDYPLSWTYKPFHPTTDKFRNAAVCPDGTGSLKKNLVCPINVNFQPNRTLPDIESMKESLRFLKEYRNRSTPYFLAIGFHKPHIPFRFPEEFLKNLSSVQFNWTYQSYKPYGMPNVAWNPFVDIRQRDDFKDIKIPLFGPVPENQRILIRQSYYASISYVDYLFGEIAKRIDFNNTIVLLTSDHGWSLGEHAEWAKYSNFEVALRVPIIIHTPDFQLNNAKKVASIVELVDVFPSLVDLAQLPSIPICKKDKFVQICTEGRSFFNLLKNHGQNSSSKVALSQYPRPKKFPSIKSSSDKPKLNQIKIMGYTMRTNNFRYTMWVQFNHMNFTKDWKKVYGRELYDHRIDRHEDINLSDNSNFITIRKRLESRLIELFSA